ncbi:MULTISPECIES: hypothetical protein [unclassified Streptomyces]|uniref:hypothetical protein n=1 Tax=unclassified Streptomyces TaxID=2593676 RepID=UPI002965E98F|nr:hypothetical protein [Streptomyces sp. SJL17-1]
MNRSTFRRVAAGALAATVGVTLLAACGSESFDGAARTPAILDNAPLTLTSANAALVAKDLAPRQVVPVHTDSWNIYSEDLRSLVKAFEDEGIEGELVDLAPDGTPKNLS